MSHIPLVKVDADQVLNAGPIKFSKSLTTAAVVMVVIGLLAFGIGLSNDVKLTWGAYYINLVFWMGLALGAVMTTVIFQIVRAKWSASIRRVAEANVNFLPVVFVLFLLTYFGKTSLFPWANAPMPGREWYMQPNFVYGRFFVLFIILFSLMCYFVRLSLRGDVAMVKEKQSPNFEKLDTEKYAANWQGASEIKAIQKRLSILGPVVVFAYAVIYSLFSFEMIMGMDTIWYSNMFGGFNFVGNIFMGWASLIITVILLDKFYPAFAKNVNRWQLWDLGKLTLGFTVLWGYMFISQYLPQWYGNMPEETQWLILRTRGLWQPFAYLTFGAAFVFPLLLFVSEDVKKTPKILATVCLVALFGVWMEKYMVIMPTLSPGYISLAHGGLVEIGIFIGFLGLYILALANFYKKFPFVAVSHPQTYGNVDW